MQIKSNQRCGFTIFYAGGASALCDLPFGHSQHHRAGSNPALQYALPNVVTETPAEQAQAQKRHEMRSKNKLHT